MARNRRFPGSMKGLGVTFEHDGAHVSRRARAAQHRAVPAREGSTAHPLPRRHRPPRGQLHGVHAVRPQLPRLVHLHRGSQDSSPRRAVPAARRARSTTSTASTSTTRCACTAASASRCARSTRCSGAPSTSTASRSIADLLHDKAKLGEWMETVPEAPELEAGADEEGQEVMLSPSTTSTSPRTSASASSPR